MKITFEDIEESFGEDVSEPGRWVDVWKTCECGEDLMFEYNQELDGAVSHVITICDKCGKKYRMGYINKPTIVIKEVNENT